MRDVGLDTDGTRDSLRYETVTVEGAEVRCRGVVSMNDESRLKEVISPVGSEEEQKK